MCIRWYKRALRVYIWYSIIPYYWRQTRSIGQGSTSQDTVPWGRVFGGIRRGKKPDQLMDPSTKYRRTVGGRSGDRCIAADMHVAHERQCRQLLSTAGGILYYSVLLLLLRRVVIDGHNNIILLFITIGAFWTHIRGLIFSKFYKYNTTGVY